MSKRYITMAYSTPTPLRDYAVLSCGHAHETMESSIHCLTALTTKSGLMSVWRNPKFYFGVRQTGNRWSGGRHAAIILKGPGVPVEGLTK